MHDDLMPGDVLKILFRDCDPHKIKFCICISPGERVFFVINSKPYRWAPADSQLTIFKQELNFLDYDSYIDVSKTHSPLSVDIDDALKRDKYTLNYSALARIREKVEHQNYLLGKIKQLVLSNFPIR